MKSIVEATEDYKGWLRRQTSVDEKMLSQKDELMEKDEFTFLRATYYRWSQVFSEVCKDIGSPRLLAVGDCHIQNFGTWRDEEGRLVWGVDDFDEADEGIPMASDLVRLAVSAAVAEKVSINKTAICDAVLFGYEEGLASEQGPFVLEKDHKWLRDLAKDALKSPQNFWSKWLNEKTAKPAKPPEREAVNVLQASFPNGALIESLLVPNPKKPKGLGSLGRKRYFGYNGNWAGGPIAREIKAAVSPATRIGKNDLRSFVDTVQSKAIRSRDPMYRLRGSWVCKAIMASTGRIEMEELARIEDQSRLLQAMGHEIANIHRPSFKNLRTAKEGLERLKRGRMNDAFERMLSSLRSDLKNWKKRPSRK